MNEKENKNTILCEKIFSEKFNTAFQQYHGIDWPRKEKYTSKNEIPDTLQEFLDSLMCQKWQVYGF